MYQEAKEKAGFPSETLYHDEVAELRYNKLLNLLSVKFLVSPDAFQFRNTYKLAIGAANSKGVLFWLTDARTIKTMLPENQEWLKMQMAPLLQGRLRKFAIIMSPECFVMTNPDKVYNKPNPVKEAPASGNIKVHFDQDSAMDWLLTGN